ncbi:MAG: ABC transporter substrate-binding protein [Firmicutes bacterium]|nr:ABC transporter substrate-binding protein [Bacillota bacterium]
MSRRLKYIVVPVLILTLFAVILGHNQRKPAPVQVQSVQVLESARTPYFLPQYIALNLGFFKEQGLDVKITTTSPEAIRAALAGNRTDFALCGLQKTVLNPLNSKEPPVAFAQIAKRDGSFLLARKDTASFQWQNAKNKTIIGGPQDYSSQIILEEVLRQNNLSPYHHITIYNNIPEALRVGAFRAGTGNYLQLGEPEATLAESKGYGRIVGSVGAAAGDMPVTVYATARENIETRPELIQKFTNSIYKALLWLRRHTPEEAADAAAPSFTNLERQHLLKTVERYKAIDIWAEDPLIAREPFDRFLLAVKNSGELANPATYEKAVTTDFARQAIDTVTYVPEIPKPEKKFPFGLFKKEKIS